MEHIISCEDLQEYIKGVTYTKGTLLRCLDVILTREGGVIDDISYITTINSEIDEGRKGCKEDEIAINIHFAGYEEEYIYIKYWKFLKLIKEGFLSNINYFGEEDKKEIQATIQILENTLNS